MDTQRPNHPEPVPAASQLAILPFIAGVEGILRSASNGAKLRITMHRIMAREGEGYLQQLCAYLGSDRPTQKPVGRMFSVDTGIMGRAFATGKIQRTRFYETIEKLRSDLRQDLIDVADARPVEQVPVSYLAVPIFGAAGKVILTLYVECDVLNFFADNDRITKIVEMCEGFCRLFDWLYEDQPFPTLRNFPLEIGQFNHTTPTVFKRLQEDLELSPPKFKSVPSFNYDAAVG